MAKYKSPPTSQFFSQLGLPDWATVEAAKAQIDHITNWNGTLDYLLVRRHCLYANAMDALGNPLNDDFNWTKVPLDASITLTYTNQSYIKLLDGTVLKRNVYFQMIDVVRTVLEANDTIYAYYEALAAILNGSNASNSTGANSSNGTNGSNGSNSNQQKTRTAADLLEGGLSGDPAKDFLAVQASFFASLKSMDNSNQNLTNLSLKIVENQSLLVNQTGIEEVQLCARARFQVTYNVLYGAAQAEALCAPKCFSNGTLDGNCMYECLYLPQAMDIKRCAALPGNSVPTNTTPKASLKLGRPPCVEERAKAMHAKYLQQEAILSGKINTSHASFQEVIIPDCFCGSIDDVNIGALWRTGTNLHQELAEQKDTYEIAKRLRSLDKTPWQTQPECLGDTILFNISESDLHPDPAYVNRSVTFRFAVKFRNPRRPPLTHLNFWVVQHRRPVPGKADLIASSGAVKSWEVVSKLRYVTIQMLNEVLRPDDTTELHFEFVTVNPANVLRIEAMYPEWFDFTAAEMASSGTYDPRPPNVGGYGGRRLLWQGFTPFIRIEKQLNNMIEFKVRFDKVEYVRFRIKKVKVPWKGGQALFSLYTFISRYPQDEIQNCCPPGIPRDNPGVVFKVPHRFKGLDGIMLNEWQNEPAIFPIASQFETRLNEYHLITFRFKIPVDTFLHPHAAWFIFIIRAPVGYKLNDLVFDIRDSSKFVPDERFEGSTRYRSLPERVVTATDSRAVLAVSGMPGDGGWEERYLSTEWEYSLHFEARTPEYHYKRKENDLWAFEITDDHAMKYDEVSMNKGSFDDFTLMSQVNFSAEAVRSPPETLISIVITLNFVGEVTEMPNRIDVYAPAGFKFILDCFAAGEEERLKEHFVSCRERFTLFNGNYLSGAILMTADGGIKPWFLPMSMTLLAITPALTPVRNDFFIRTYKRLGPVGWGLLQNAFPVVQMQAVANYPGIAGSIIPMFIATRVIHPIPWGGFIHLAGPLTYRILCPITKMLLGDVRPNCTHEDPLLNGCFGLPLANSPDIPFGVPGCQPEHEVLLSFQRPPNNPDVAARKYAIEAGTNLLFSMDIAIPMVTPRKADNVFRIRALDPNKASIDGNLNIPGQGVRTVPVAEDFSIWFTKPSGLMTVAIKFTFNSTMPREKEAPGKQLRVIQIVAPDRFRMSVRRPRDVVNLKKAGRVAVTEWNWTIAMPRMLWFGLDMTQNVTGTFHFAFPVMMPTKEQGLPFDNLWEVKLCADSPFCNEQLLSVPIPGFFFGEEPAQALSDEAQKMLAGGGAIRLCSPSLIFILCLMAQSLFSS
eukprot:TRINITY_DN27033_c0_g1_i1.p1 TRINITY_DN27033_c0_g1~~TRINITY_DN27033_c0_g1_i1.p1  ORF type:complete len:1449 (+),score=239.76 TRINITY_DN27033_c0_g1_i1:458-4348(+)